FNAGQTVPNLVIAKVGAGGWISIYNRLGNTHVIVDVMGWFATTDTQGLAIGASETVSVDIYGRAINGYVSGVSADGRYSLLTTGNATLWAGGAPQPAVLVRDSVLGISTVVTAATAMNYRVSGAGLTADGRYALWTTSAGLVPEDTNGVDDVYLTDLSTGYLYLLSYDPTTKAVGNGRSQARAISPNGWYVTFATMSTNLAAGTGTTGRDDLVVRDQTTGAATRVVSGLYASTQHGRQSVADNGAVAYTDTGQVYVLAAGVRTLVSQPTGTTGTGGNGYSFEPAISRDGRYVSFTSTALLDATKAGNVLRYDIYLRDTIGNTTTLVSHNAAGTAGGNENSTWSSISADGSTVVYQSDATDLVAAPVVTVPWTRVYRWVRGSAITKMVSATPGGEAADATTLAPIVSTTGAYVGYSTDASNLVLGGVSMQGLLTKVG
ncbi:MAG TPA: hypothetical protein VFP72_11770, partial [Kineosporiaceae bacterium]|nr:hypothetical protein [Kineosporiaceae bacterium]